ncbi:MAG: hypothetical protein IPN24_18450 [Betaproteobacteria bacterium]|nr:hypothetical protein [Betaproteobacteria bacterium]
MSEHDFKHVDVALERDVGVDAYQASRCRALIAATMLQAVRDIAPPRYRITDDEWLQTRQDALAWFADEGDEPFTVRWCCQQLDLDYEIVMTGVRFHEGELSRLRQPSVPTCAAMVRTTTTRSR